VNALLDEFAHAIRSLDEPFLVLLVGTTYALVSSAFILGGFWALRGRVALRSPGCRRCGALLRGEGDEPPATCPECGRVLTARNAVRWLRFRRQPATFLVTGPVVLFGGLVLSWAAVGVTAMQVDARAERWELRQAAFVPATTQATDEATAPQFDRAWLDALIARVEAGGLDGARALVEISDSLGVSSVGSEGADLCVGLVERMADGLIPRVPFEPPEAARGASLSSVLGHLLRTSLVLERKLLERIDALVLRLFSSVRIVARPAIAPGQPLQIMIESTQLDAFGPWGLYLDELTLNGIPLEEATGQWTGGTATAPEEPGPLRIVARWTLKSTLEAERDLMSGTSETVVQVADATPDLVIADDLSRGDGLSIIVGVPVVEGKRVLSLRVQDIGSVGLAGRFEVLVGTTWIPVLEHDRRRTWSTFGALVLDESLGDAVPTQVRYVPRDDLRSAKQPEVDLQQAQSQFLAFDRTRLSALLGTPTDFPLKQYGTQFHRLVEPRWTLDAAKRP
jgi:hypothetical protein